MTAIVLTAPQEAAFNAATEAMAELAALGAKNCSLHFYPDEMRVMMRSTDDPFAHSVMGKGPTGAEAVADALRLLDEQLSAPPKLRTAKEAIEAVKTGLDEIFGEGENTVHRLHIFELIDGLPVA